MIPNEIDPVDAPNWLYRPSFPDAWPKAKLSSLARWINGMAFKDFQFSEVGRPIIKIAEIKNGIAGQTKFTLAEYDKVYLIHKGDLLFSWSGQPETSIDAFWWPGPDGWLNQHVFKVVPNQALVSQDFLYYLLKYLNPNFVAIARNKQTTGLGHVTKADIAEIEVGIPSPEEQQAIVDQIWSIDRKIDLNRQINQTLEQMAQALFQAWFVDFEPVKAKVAAVAEGRDPLRAAMSTLSGKTDAELDELPGAAFDTLAATAALFPEEMEESALGAVPKGWDVASIGSFAEITIGGDWGKDEADASNNVQAISLRGVDLEHLRKTGDCPKAPTRWVKRSSVEKRTPQETDVLIGGSGAGPCGRPLWLSSKIYSMVEHPLVYSNFVKRIRCQSTEYAIYLDAVLWGMFVSGEIHTYINGTSVPNLNDKGLMMKNVIVPSRSVLRGYETIARENFSMLYSGQNKSLATLRDSLLPKLLSGEIAVMPEEAEGLAGNGSGRPPAPSLGNRTD